MSVDGLAAFARERSLPFDAGGRTSDATPLLAGLKDGRSLGAVNGELATGLNGTLAAVQPEQPDAPTRIAIETRIPESIGLLPVLTCRDARRDLFDRTVGAGGVFKLQKEVQLESIKLGRKFLIGVAQGQDDNWVRQLFSPTFIDYLAETAPEDCHFELYSGVLAVGAEGRPSAESLEILCEVAAQVAERLRSESLEQKGLGARSWRGADDERLRHYEQKQEELLAGVRFDALPASVGAAANRFGWRVRRMPFVWISSLALAALLGLVFVGIPAAVLLPLAGFIADGAELPWATIWTVVGVLYALVMVALTIKLARGQIELRKTMLGLEAFVRLYARERGLELVEGRRFHSENVTAELPGVALYALRGGLPGTAINGALVIAKDQATRRAHLEYSLTLVEGERTLASSPETAVSSWSAATLDNFCASSARA